MARIRTIKPDFWTDESVVELSPMARLLFIGLWNFADDSGRMVCSPKRIKMQVFPGDSTDLHQLLVEISGEGLITIYCVDNVDYLQVNGFSKHQKIDPRFESKLPAPPISTDSHPFLALEGKGREGNGGERKGKEGKGEDKISATPLVEQGAQLLPPENPPNGHQRKTADDVRRVFSHWQSVMNKPRAKLDDKRKRAIAARLKDKYPVADLCKAIDGCKASAWHQGQNDRGTVVDELEYICRNAGNVDKLMAIAEQPAALQRMGPAGRATAMAGMDWLDDMAEGQADG